MKDIKNRGKGLFINDVIIFGGYVRDDRLAPPRGKIGCPAPPRKKQALPRPAPPHGN